MSGLLSQFTEFAKTPEGQGLLSAAFGGLAGAQRGAPMNSIGRAGLAGLAGYSGALDRQTQQADNAFNQQFKQAQLDDFKRKQAEAQAQQQWRAGLPGVMKQMEPTYGAGDEGPTMTPGNPNAVNEYLMRPESPFLDDVLKQKFNKPRAVVVGSDFVREQDDGTVKVLHSSQRPESLPSDVKAYNIAVDQGYKGTLMEFMRDRVANTEGAKAGFDIVEITTPDGQTFKVPRSVAATMAGGGSTPTGGVTPPRTGTPRPIGSFQGGGYQGGSAGAAAGQQREILTRELTAAQRDGRTQDIAALQRELGRVPGGPGLQVQSEADKLRASETIKSEATSAASTQKDRFTARKFLNQAAYAERLLKQNPTGSGIGAARDSVLSVFGVTTDAAKTARELEAVSGWLVSNVPRMEGPQSNFDVDNYKVMAAAVGNKTLPVDERLAALQTVQQMMRDIIEPAASPAGSNTPSAPKATMRFNRATDKFEQVR